MASTFELKDSKGNTFSAAMVGPICRLGDGRMLEYVDAEDTFRICRNGRSSDAAPSGNSKSRSDRMRSNT